jgi:hypothetical protein
MVFLEVIIKYGEYACLAALETFSSVLDTPLRRGLTCGTAHRDRLIR